MSINFSPSRWDKIRRDYSLWWERKLERPLIPVILTGKTSDLPKPSNPLLTQKNCSDLSISPKEIINGIDYALSTYEFLGDSFPMFNMDCFGPGVVAAFLGADLENTTGNVWFHTKEILPINELHFEYDPDNIWLNRIKEIYFEGSKRWQGQVIFSMPDLGGVLDILSTFRSADNLLMDLYDEPDEVKRLTTEIDNLWHRYYKELSEIIKSNEYGYTDWSSIYCTKPSYVIQSDFSYMIGPSMFDEFIKPELESTCQRLHNTIYHLDGVGQLNHLDSLLKINELDAVQWVPGDGKPDPAYWPEVQKKIIDSGKNIQIYGNAYTALPRLVEQLGTGKGIHHRPIWNRVEEKSKCLELLSKFGAD